MFNRKLRDFLEPPCFKSNEVARLDLLMTSKNGIVKVPWKFDTSQNLEVDCILGSDFLLDMKTSPVVAFKPNERLLIISEERLSQE